MAGTDGPTVSLNGAAPVPCQLSIQTDQIDVSTFTASKPDPSWEFVDAAGHFHAFDHEGNLPTVARREELIRAEPDAEELDDDWDVSEYTIIHMVCALCGERIEPRRVPDNPYRTIPGRTSYTVTLHSPIPDGRFSVVVRLTDKVWFGFGEGQLIRAEHGPAGVVSTYEVYGGPLAWRTAASDSVVPTT